MTQRIADLVFRLRYASAAVIVLGTVLFLPSVNFTDIDNELSAWIDKDDPVYQQYEQFRTEFGGQRTLLIALRSKRLFEPGVLKFIEEISGDIERVPLVERVQSLATANVVRSTPPTSPDDDGGIEVRPLIEGVTETQQQADEVRIRALADNLLRDDLVSRDGTVTVIAVSFDEDRIDDARGDTIERIHELVDPRLPPGLEVFYNGPLEISETYNRITIENTLKMTPPILALTVLGIYVMFRSWRITGLLVIAVIASAVWTMGLYSAMGFEYNILASMIPPLVLILAVADDVHIVQHFSHELRDGGSYEQAFKSSVRHLFAPILAASGTTAIGLLSLATSDVVAVRQFGIGAAVGVMVDFALSLTFVPFLLVFLERGQGMAPQERYLTGPLQRVARFSISMAKPVLVVTAVVLMVCGAGVFWLRVDTNHINFFAESHPLHQSAEVIDGQLSGIYSFNVMLEGPPDSMKSLDTLKRMEALRIRLQQLPYVKKVVSLADYVKRVNRELNDGDPAAEVLPGTADAIAQELFVFGLSDDGRTELSRVVTSDYSRSHVAVKMASLSSDLVFEQINRAEEEATAVFAGSEVKPIVTGAGRMFSTLDHYLVTSQLTSFGTAFLTVFAVVFFIFRSAPFGLLGIVANALPVCAVLGLMGWMGISLNVATIMVSSVALGIVDDDTIHFISRFRREVGAGRSIAEAIELSTMHEGRASLTTAVINSVGYGVMMLSEYKPSAWFGGLLALTMLVAFLAEVFVVPSVIVTFPRFFARHRFVSMDSAA